MQPAFICRSCLSRLKQHAPKRLHGQQPPLLTQAWQDGTRSQALGLTTGAGQGLLEQRRKLGTISQPRSRIPEGFREPAASTYSQHAHETTPRSRSSPHPGVSRQGDSLGHGQEYKRSPGSKEPGVPASKTSSTLQTVYSPLDEEFWGKFEETFDDFEVVRGESSISISDSLELYQDLDAARIGTIQERGRSQVEGDPSRQTEWVVDNNTSDLPPRQTKMNQLPGSKPLFRPKYSRIKDYRKTFRQHHGDIAPLHNPIDRLQTYNEYGYLRHHLDSAELKQFNKWKNTVKEIRSLRVGYKHAPDKMIRKLKWLLSYETVQEMDKAWQTLDTDRRKRIWPNIMISALICCPDKAQKVLHATMLDPLQPGYAIKDVMHFIAMRLSLLSTENVTAEAEALCDTVLAALKTMDHDHIRFRQNFFYFLCTKIGTAKLEELYNCLIEKNMPLHSNTLLQFASRFAQDTAYKNLALQILVRAVESGDADLNAPKWASLCTAILYVKAEDSKKDGLLSPADAFGVLLEHGLVPNMVNYTSLIRALCVAGQSRTAWDVVHMMQQQNIKPDPIVLATLFNGAKNALDPDTMGKVITMAIEHDVIDVTFWNDILSSVLYFADAEAREKKMQIPRAIPAFGPMLRFYSKVFDLAPLQELIPIDLTQILDNSIQVEMPLGWDVPGKLFPMIHQATLTVTNKLPPTSATLCIMFIAYVKSLSQPYSLISLYAYIRQLVMKGHTVATNVVQEKGTFFHDVLIKALCEWPGMLRAALDIVGDMLKETLQETSSVAAITPGKTEISDMSDVLHPTPSVYTWSILLNGFMFHKQKPAGDRIFSMMRQHRIKPNLVTWNTLIAGYAREQNVKRTVHALHRLEAEGFEADSFTMRAFSRLIGKTAAFQEMQNTIDRQKERETRLQTAGLGLGAPPASRVRGFVSPTGLKTGYRKVKESAELGNRPVGDFE